MRCPVCDGRLVEETEEDGEVIPEHCPDCGWMTGDPVDPGD